MLADNWSENNKALISLVKEHFGDGVSCFYSYSNESNRDSFVECLVYRAFMLRFSLGDISQGGAFGIGVFIGDWPVDLETLTDWHEGISLNFTREAVLGSLEVLDKYLQWRMTDAQKETFGLL